MRLTNGIDISSSALTAQRLRMDVISSNIANADTIRAKQVNGKWVPYQRKLVTLETKSQPTLVQTLKSAMADGTGEGVRVNRIIDDNSPLKQVYNPTHPDADVNGFVMMP